MFLKNSIRLKTLLPIILATIIAGIIEYFRFINVFPYYNRCLRNFDHLIAGIILPYYIFHSSSKISTNLSCVAYGFFCLAWEFGEFCGRGYFQFDQFCYDLIGVAIIFLLFILFNFKNKGLI